MANEIIEQKYNNNGDLIVAEEKDGGRTMQEIKFGLIKLMGDKKEYRVSFKTLCDIEKSRQQGFDGNVVIKELGMSVKMSQIVMCRSEVEQRIVADNFTKLPSEGILMVKENGEMVVSTMTRTQHLSKGVSYWQCNVHYSGGGSDKRYLTDFDKIKRAVHIFIDDGYEVVKEIYEYGVEKCE